MLKDRPEALVEVLAFIEDYGVAVRERHEALLEAHQLRLEGAMRLGRDPFALVPVFHAYADGVISTGKARECTLQWLAGTDFRDEATRVWEQMAAGYVEPGSRKNLVDGLRGNMVKAYGEAHAAIDQLGVPRYWKTTRGEVGLSVGQRVRLAAAERQQFRKTIGQLMDEVRELRARAGESSADVLKVRVPRYGERYALVGDEVFTARGPMA